ncbi:MAG: hypothetical protein WDK96_02250 [Candidatus Paceibacterota bacterium]|jgi:hypothetical protein
MSETKKPSKKEKPTWFLLITVSTIIPIKLIPIRVRDIPGTRIDELGFFKLLSIRYIIPKFKMKKKNPTKPQGFVGL